MVAVAALLGRSVCNWLLEQPGLMTHHVRPASLLYFLNGVTAMVLAIDMMVLFGVALRPALREWLTCIIEDATQLWGAVSSGDTEYVQRYRDDMSDAAFCDVQVAALRTELSSSHVVLGGNNQEFGYSQ